MNVSRDVSGGVVVSEQKQALHDQSDWWCTALSSMGGAAAEHGEMLSRPYESACNHPARLCNNLKRQNWRATVTQKGHRLETIAEQFIRSELFVCLSSAVRGGTRSAAETTAFATGRRVAAAIC
jgi:hypothetical protein